MTPRRIVIAGAGLAGSRCAQTLRAEGFEGAITLIGEEAHVPYERPALSKEYLAGARRELALRPGSDWAAEGIDLLLGTRVVRIDVRGRRLSTASGDHAWDALVLATGAGARRLPGFGGPGVHILHTLDDARRLRATLARGGRLAIVGAGLVGAEVASTAVARGVDVAMVDPCRLPFERLLGAEVGRMLADRYIAHGVDLRLETGVAGLRRSGGGAVRALALEGGGELPCDHVLVAVGAQPDGRLLGAATAIETDEVGRSAFPGVFACGDVAAPWQPALGRHLALPHWTSAAHQGAAVARAILGHDPVVTPAPYFWSDQFGLRLQHVGFGDGWTSVRLDAARDSLAARYLARDGRLAAALLVNRPHELPRLRRALAEAPAAA